LFGRRTVRCIGRRRWRAVELFNQVVDHFLQVFFLFQFLGDFFSDLFDLLCRGLLKPLANDIFDILIDLLGDEGLISLALSIFCRLLAIRFDDPDGCRDEEVQSNNRAEVEEDRAREESGESSAGDGEVFETFRHAVFS
jgi:hypothetical protein